MATKDRLRVLFTLGRILVLTAMGMTTQSFHTAQAEKIHPEQGTESRWSKPVNGIRARLIATRKEFPLEHPSSLLMVFQNIGDRPVLLPGGVNLLPTVTIKSEKPSGRDHDFNAAVRVSQQKKRPPPLSVQQPLVRQIMESTTIQPGDLHMVVINLSPISSQERLHHSAMERSGDVQRERLKLMVTEPGVYLMEATWKPEGLATIPDRQNPRVGEAWKGKRIDFPPIEIRIRKHERRSGDDER